nr:CarD family transcriptional regulator [Spirochaetota bacterium]
MILKAFSDTFILSDEYLQIKDITGKSGRGERGASVEGIAQSSFPLIVASIFNDRKGQVIAVTENSQKMQDLYTDVTCFTDPDLVFMLPPWETLPYEFVSPPESIERDRVTALYRILRGDPCLIITTVESLVRKIPEKKFFMAKGMTLNAGEEYPFDDLVEMLADYGYTREHRVEAYGHFSVKGGIIDIYLPSEENPVRLDFFGDTLESIREFSVMSQISQGGIDSVTIYPRGEMVLFSREKEKLRASLKKALDKGKDFPDDVRHFIAGGHEAPRGIEDIFPLITGSDSLLSLIDDKAFLVLCERPELESKNRSLENIFTELYARKKDSTLCLPPEELLDTKAFDTAMDRALRLQVFTSSSGALQWKLRSIPGFRGKIKQVREEIGSRLDRGWKICITTGFEGQARRLYDLLNDFNPGPDFESFDPEKNFSIVISPLREGIELCEENILLLSDHEIFGKSYRKKRFKKKTSRPIDSFLDLKSGDYVVHINHGIGVFSGIERMTAGGVERDFLLIEYAEGDKLYVSLDQIVMVQKYIGIEGRKPRIDSLGKKSAWNRIKEKVRQSVEEIAKELIVIYSKRNALRGFQFPPDTQWQEEFESLFEFEETPDQITAIEDVKDDMENSRPMDRLVCGDVGFGKTEVAIRAAFKAVMAGRQVAILVPTTVLAMQHFSTFKKRFTDYPMEVEMISRFRTAGEIKKIKDRLSEGRIDIIIGTHALLAKDISIKNLGLLVIDEEQRFGVKHKEQIKKIRALVDVLTLSA